MSYEGRSMRKTRIDMMASQFETLTMGDDESIEVYNEKLSSIANEALVLGQNYKDKKMVRSSSRVCLRNCNPTNLQLMCHITLMI